jgi:hypothetical protein
VPDVHIQAMRVCETHPEKDVQGSIGGPIVVVDDHQIPQPAGYLAAGGGRCEALVSQNDGAVVMPMTNHTAHRLIYGSVTAADRLRHLPCLTSFPDRYNRRVATKGQRASDAGGRSVALVLEARCTASPS